MKVKKKERKGKKKNILWPQMRVKVKKNENEKKRLDKNKTRIESIVI